MFFHGLPQKSEKFMFERNAGLVLSRYSTNLMSSNICLVFTIFIWLSET